MNVYTDIAAVFQVSEVVVERAERTGSSLTTPGRPVSAKKPLSALNSAVAKERPPARHSGFARGGSGGALA